MLCSEMPWEEDCVNTEEQIYRTLVGRGKVPNFVRLPVDTDEISWIQWYGGTETAYQDHLDYKNGEDNYGYDEYCQGLHCGIDFGAEWGTPVYAGVYGSVVDVGNGTGGLVVLIEIGDYQFQYLHLSNISVAEGDYISPGTAIGGVGNLSGLSAGGNIHLHLEVRFSSTGKNQWKDRISNPLLYMNTIMIADLTAIAEMQKGNNVTFHDPFSNYSPLAQPSPIIRGGGVVWE